MRHIGVVTPISTMSRAVIIVKMQSIGQGTFWGSVKWSSSVLGTTNGDQEALLSLCACAVGH